MNINRRKDILNDIYKTGSVKVSQLAQKYGLNDATIRRDLKFLAQNYGINMTYGGAYVEHGKADFSIWENPHELKRQENFQQKQIIARKAAKLVTDGDTIALSAGSTAEFILDYLEGITRLNIITLCLNIATKATRLPYVTVFVPGGKIRNSSGVVYGPNCECYLKSFSVDKCFLGVAAVSHRKGITHPVLEEVSGNRALLDIAEKKYLIADSSKFDCVSLVKIADLDEFDAFITDDNLPQVYKRLAEVNNIQLV